MDNSTTTRYRGPRTQPAAAAAAGAPASHVAASCLRRLIAVPIGLVVAIASLLGCGKSSEEPSAGIKVDPAADVEKGHGDHQEVSTAKDRWLAIITGIAFYGFYNCAVQILPVCIDLKLIADPGLPGLTERSLPQANSASFMGYTVGSVLLPAAKHRYGSMGVMKWGTFIMGVAVYAMAMLPSLTGGSIVMLSIARFVAGAMMSVGAFSYSFCMEYCPASWAQGVIIVFNLGFASWAIAFGFGCMTWSQSLDPSWEVLVWCGAPVALTCVCLATMNPPPKVAPAASQAPDEGAGSSSSGGPTAAEPTSMFSPVWLCKATMLAYCFVAAGLVYFGLSYSAGKISPNVYHSIILINLIDIPGYLLAFTANVFGRRRVQSIAFAIAGICLFLGRSFDPSGYAVLCCAMVGHMCVNICFSTIYAAVVDTFPLSIRTGVYGLCQLGARSGSIFAPLCGTLPASISCALFAMSSIIAAACTLV